MTAYEFGLEKIAKEGFSEEKAKEIVNVILEKNSWYDEMIEAETDITEKAKLVGQKEGFIYGVYISLIYTYGAETQKFVEEMLMEEE